MTIPSRSVNTTTVLLLFDDVFDSQVNDEDIFLTIPVFTSRIKAITYKKKFGMVYQKEKIFENDVRCKEYYVAI